MVSWPWLCPWIRAPDKASGPNAGEKLKHFGPEIITILVLIRTNLITFLVFRSVFAKLLKEIVRISEFTKWGSQTRLPKSREKLLGLRRIKLLNIILAH